MSLITEEERDLFRQTPIGELAKLVEKRKRGLGVYTAGLSRAKAGLREDYFWVLADPDKTVDDKSEELGLSKRTIIEYIHALRKAGFLKQSGPKYSKEILEEAESRYGDLKSLREAVGEELSEGRVFTCHDLCEALGVPPVPRNEAKRNYGAEYNVYTKLHGLLVTSIRRGEIEYFPRGDERVYRCLKSIETQEKIKADVLKLSKTLAEYGPCSLDLFCRNAGVYRMRTKRLLNLVEDMAVISRPNATKYDFFSECFGRAPKLLMDAKNDTNLQRMTDKLIGCLPEEVYPWFKGDIERQLCYMRKNGLPDQVVKSVRAAYASRLVEV